MLFTILKQLGYMAYQLFFNYWQNQTMENPIQEVESEETHRGRRVQSNSEEEKKTREREARSSL